METFQHVVVLLLLTLICGGQMQETDPPLQIVAMVGEDVVLPCQLDPPSDAVSLTVEWGRLDLNPRFVYVWHKSQELDVDQNPAYKQRASMSISKLRQGDLSLTITNVKHSDNGNYRCYIPTQNKVFFVELLVGSASPPGQSSVGLHKASTGVYLDCKSEGWYPEPEVSWLDAEGKQVSAVKTETVRGPDDLYTVSSRLTVAKRDSDSFTCRIQQKEINQTRETLIYVSDDFFLDPPGCTSSITTSVLFALMFTAAVVLFVWKLRNQEAEWKMHHNLENEESRKQLMKKEKENEDLKKKEKLAELHEELKRKEEEQKEMTPLIEKLEDLNEEQKKQKEVMSRQLKETQRVEEENEKKVKEVDKEVSEKEGDKMANKAQGYLKLKIIFLTVKENQEKRRQEEQDVQMNSEKVTKKTIDGVNMTKERKKKVDEQLEQIKKRIEEMEKPLT